MRVLAWLLLAGALAGGCGGSLEADGGRPLDAKLTVAVRPRGPAGPVKERRIECGVLGERALAPTCRRLRGLTADDLAPVPKRAVCTAIFGGDATARVTGRLHGRRIASSFSLRNGCEIARWRRNAKLLGPPPGLPER